MPRRQGDAADMAMIELVDFNEIYNTGATADQKKTRRSRRGTGAAKPASTTAAPATGATAMDTDARATAEAAHEAAEADIAAAETTETVIPSTDDSGEATAPEAPAQKEGGEGAGA